MKEFLAVLKKYAVIKGRASRKEYWTFILVNSLIYIFLSFVGVLTHLFIIPALYNLAMIIPSFAVTVRRLHDVNKSGWWQFLPMIPALLTGVAMVITRSQALLVIVPFALAVFAAGIYVFVLLVRKGDPSENRFGPASQEPVASQV